MPLPSTNRIMKKVRRIHLYTGLFMFPWILVYGISGFIFNHPRWFSPKARANSESGREECVLPESVWKSGALAPVASPAGLAEQVFAALKAAPEAAADLADARIVGEAVPRFSRVLLLEGSDGRGGFEVQVNLNEHAGKSVRRGPPARRSKEAAPLTVQTEGVARMEPARLAALAEALQGAEVVVARAKLRVKAVPDLEFDVESGDRTWQVRYNLTTGEALIKEVTERRFEWIGFLLRLHKAHFYPDRIGVRWWWALIVDCSAVLLCVWAITGVAMWWQMKGQRRWGAAVLAACVVVALSLGSGMAAVFR